MRQFASWFYQSIIFPSTCFWIHIDLCLHRWYIYTQKKNIIKNTLLLWVLRKKKYKVVYTLDTSFQRLYRCKAPSTQATSSTRKRDVYIEYKYIVKENEHCNYICFANIHTIFLVLQKLWKKGKFARHPLAHFVLYSVI